MFNKITSLFGSKQEQSGKETIPELSVNLHDQALNELRVLGSIAKTLDTPAFDDPDFQFYIKTCALFASNKGQYQGLKDSSELLNVAVQAQSSFLKIEQTELRYCSSKQQEYYKFVLDFLGEKFAQEENNNNDLGQVNVGKKSTKKQYSPEEFKQKIRAKLAEITPTIKTEQGQQALEDYTDSLEILAQDKELGLKLLYLFKKFNLTDFSVLRVISEMVAYLQDKDMRHTKAIQDLVMKNQEIFLNVGRIIGVPKESETAEIYARMLQFLALSRKHEKSSKPFFRLLDLLRQWKSFYTTVHDIREEYPANKYQLPDKFKAEIPGLNTYEKYEEYLTIFK